MPFTYNIPLYQPADPAEHREVLVFEPFLNTMEVTTFLSLLLEEKEY